MNARTPHKTKELDPQVQPQHFLDGLAQALRPQPEVAVQEELEVQFEGTSLAALGQKIMARHDARAAMDDVFLLDQQDRKRRDLQSRPAR